MKNLLYTGLVIFFLALALLAPTQSKAQKEAKTYYTAEEAMAAEDFQTALDLYEEVAQTDPKFEGTEFKTAACQLMLDPEKPVDSYLSLESFYSSDEHYFYWLAKIYLKKYQFEDAAVAFRRFQQQSEYNGNMQDESVKQLIEKTTHLLAFFDHPDNYEIHQLESPVNSAGNELTPVYSEQNKELLFASNKGGRDYKIYFSKKNPEGWSSPKELSILGTFSESTANVEVVNEDGKLFIFREDNGGDLYYSQPNGDNWTAPVEFDSKVSNNQLASHFYINEHEDRIIFAYADKNNGLDIYETFRDPANDKWSKPAPFSSSINTPFNEDSPFLSADEKSLYFVSDRPGGLGGFDIYVSTYDASTYSWSEPKNMGWPINSPDEEFHFKMNNDQTSGYFVSDRLHTKGGFDIYFYWQVEKVKITGRLIDKLGNPMNNAQIRFHPSQYSDEYFHSTTDAQGKYAMEIFSDEVFSVEILNEGKIIFEDRFEVHDSEGQNIVHHKDFRIN